MRRLAAGALAFAALVAGSGARASSFGTNAAEFLRLPVGDPAGMSEAGGSVARDASALYWNPAGLAALDRPEVRFSHDGLPESLTHDFLAASLPLRGALLGGTAGYSLQVLSMGSIDRLDNQGRPAGSFSASDIAQTFGWARAFGGLRAGASLRLVRQTIDATGGGTTALGFGLQEDFGAWSAGASVNNLGPGLALGPTVYPLPLAVRAGGSFTGIENELFLAGDLSLESGRGLRLHGGVEYRVFPPWEVYSDLKDVFIAVRTGYTLGGSDVTDGPSGFAVGGSVAVGPFRADVEYQPFGSLGNSAQFGLGYRF